MISVAEDKINEFNAEKKEFFRFQSKDLTRLEAKNPYGDGTTSAQIENIIRNYFI